VEKDKHFASFFCDQIENFAPAAAEETLTGAEKVILEG
jgi:hypothetical protein